MAKIHSTEGDKMVKKGSAIKLNCTVDVDGMVHSSMAVFWYRDNIVLNWMGQTGPGWGVSMVESRGSQLESYLRIEQAGLEHGGRYTCGPTIGISDNITVHIMEGNVVKLSLRIRNSFKFQLLPEI